ncbi:MAG: prephenate dehydrogenase/arogenate dehydrogenase family protein [Planctomycetales bacterium]|nr:prephenate dehydrogenase/arogenate dehydrogenase family protein [Planctomycetales bacterium]
MALRLQNTQVTIVGLGLMGGSLAAALTARRACRRVVGVAWREEIVTQALAMGVIHEGTCHLVEGIGGADVVVLATPVRAIIKLISEIGSLLPPGCLLTDVGSTKQAVVQAMQALPPHVQPVGGHPMCGKETAGLSAADSSLYEGATYVLTPLARTSDDALALAREMAQAIGARPLLLDAPCHDSLVAAISHLPYLLAVGLVATAERLANDTVWEVAASGFRDTSRLAASDEAMMLDILLTNRTAVRQMLARFQDQLAGLAHLLETGDEAGLRAAMTAAAQRRRRLFQ